MKLLSFLAKACAILAGLLLTVITLITCASLIGRNTTGTTLLGDYELTAVAAGAAVSASGGTPGNGAVGSLTGPSVRGDGYRGSHVDRPQRSRPGSGRPGAGWCGAG